MGDSPEAEGGIHLRADMFSASTRQFFSRHSAIGWRTIYFLISVACYLGLFVAPHVILTGSFTVSIKAADLEPSGDIRSLPALSWGVLSVMVVVFLLVVRRSVLWFRFKIMHADSIILALGVASSVCVSLWFALPSYWTLLWVAGGLGGLAMLLSIGVAIRLLKSATDKS